MIALVTGSSGSIGRALVPRLIQQGWTVRRVVRGLPGPGEIAWSPQEGRINAAAMEGADAVIHLAGEPIMGERWTPDKKRRITESRAAATRLLCGALAGLKHPPACLLSASGVGYYGSRGGEMVDESCSSGSGFLAGVCAEWEAATAGAERAGIRVVTMRIGVVLDRGGGALKQMLPAFRLGLGGPLGTGRQYLGWITLEDLLRAFGHLLASPGLRGAFNLTAPVPVTSAELAREMGRILRRPAVCRVPTPLLRLMFGEFADEALTSSIRAVPKKLLDSGFTFLHPEIRTALETQLRAPA